MELDAHFWLSLLEIIYVNIILSGDNAVVIALACPSSLARTTPPHLAVPPSFRIFSGTL